MPDVTLPLNGLYYPLGTYTNYDKYNGRAIAMQNWQIENGVLGLPVGYFAIPSQAAETSQYTRLLYAYENPPGGANPGERRYLYFNNGNLKLFGEAMGDVTIQASMGSTGVDDVIPFVEFRGFAFFFVGTTLYRFNPVDSSLTTCGVTAPTTAASGASGGAGSLTGAYKLVYTYVNAAGHESNPSTEMTSAFTASANKITWTVTAGPTGTAKRRLYRTVAGGSAYLYLGVINDNTTLTFSDDVADTTLGNEAEYTNDPPPAITALSLAASSNRIFLLDGTNRKVYCSKTDTTTGEPNYEAFSTSLIFDVPFGAASDTPRCLYWFNRGLYIASKYQTYKMEGDPGVGVTVNPVLPQGVHSYCAFHVSPIGVFFVNQYFQVTLWDTENAPVHLSQPIQSLLPTDDPVVLFYKLLYDYSKNWIYLYGGSDQCCYVFNLNEKAWWRVDYDPGIMAYHPKGQYVVFCKIQKSTIQKVYGTVLFGGSRPATQKVTYFFMPQAGRESFVSRLGFCCVPLVSSGGVKPQLKVSLGFDGEDPSYTEYLDLSSERTLPKGLKQPTLITEYVPVERRLKSMIISVESVNNTPSLTTVGIHRVFADVELDEQSDDSGKNLVRR